MKLLEGKVAVVTGAARGIGKAIAIQFAKEGANVAFTDLAIDENGKKTEEELNALGVKAKGYASNAANFEDTHKVIDQIMQDFGRIDILVNNAGISHIGLFTDMTPAEWNHVLDVNLGSVLNCTHLAVPAMVSEKDGVILNISSMWGEVGASCEAVYSASKGGINAFTKAMAKELGPSHIRVNAISCGVIDTEMNACFSEDERQALADEIPLMRFGQPEEVAELAVFLADRRASFLTGKIITLDGGML